MRRPIEKLARLIEAESSPTDTLGELAAKYEEPTERIMDAIEVGKILYFTKLLYGAPLTYF